MGVQHGGDARGSVHMREHRHAESEQQAYRWLLRPLFWCTVAVVDCNHKLVYHHPIVLATTPLEKEAHREATGGRGYQIVALKDKRLVSSHSDLHKL